MDKIRKKSKKWKLTPPFSKYWAWKSKKNAKQLDTGKGGD